MDVIEELKFWENSQKKNCGWGRGSGVGSGGVGGSGLGRGGRVWGGGVRGDVNEELKFL